MEEVALHPREFQRRYAVSRATMYRLIKAGEIKAFKTNRRTLVDAESAANWYSGLAAMTSHTF